MKKSWLVQRLSPPVNGPLLGVFKDNPFSFGAGLRNGGLSPDAMDVLRDVWSFDYMGAAEYEWGAVPEALAGLAGDHKKLCAFSFDIPLAEVAKDFRDKSRTVPDGSAPVYVLCRRDDSVAVEVRVRAWAAGDRSEEYRLRDATYLSQALRPYAPVADAYRTVGWLELTNGFLFFTNRAMWRRASEVFGVSVIEDVDA